MKSKFLSLFLLFFQLLFSQQEVKKDTLDEPLKVGVVLSGGGAKGLAHIGALQIIEEAGIHIDYIAGTSMGAIIGGLYAAGYTPQQMDSIFFATDFNKLIRDEIPRNAKTFYERKEDEKYAFSLNFDEFKIRLPSGLSKGQNVYNFLAQLTAHVETDDFSQLSTPFFCIATDLETGAEIIIDRGSMPLALSASGAIPSVFRPIQVGDKILTDGGVSNNYPVEELRKRGANIIIGIDVQDTLYSRDRLKSGIEVMTQVNNFTTIKAMKEKSKLTDIYIRPDISNFSVLDFEKGGRIIENGRIGTRLFFEELLALSRKQNRKPQSHKKVKALDSLKVSEIEIVGNKRYPRNYIRGKLKLEIDEKTSFTAFNNGLNNLSATQNFDRIHYHFFNKPDQSKGLQLQVTESQEKRLLRFGLHYDDLYKSAILLNYTQKSLLVNNDILSLDLIVGDNLRYNFNYYIDKGKYWSIGVKSRFNRFENNVDFSFVQDVVGSGFDGFNVNKIQLLNQDFTNQLYMETMLLSDFKFGVGVEQKWLRAKTETILADENEFELEPETIIEEFNLLSTYGYLEYDSQDHKYYPSKGFHFYGDMHIYLTSILESKTISQFSIAKGQIAYVHPIVDRLSLRIGSEMGLRIGGESLGGLNFFLGGFGNQPINNFRPFYGYDFISLSADSYISGNFDLFYNFYKNHYVIASGNFANVKDSLFDSGDWLSSPDFTGYALGYGLKTFLGPIDLKYSYSPEVNKSIWFISLGHRF